MINVTVLLLDKMLATSATLPTELLVAANTQARALRCKKKQHKPFSITFASMDGEAVSTQSGLKLSADCAIQQAPQADIIYLPALWRNPEPTLRTNSEAIPWLKSQFKKGSLLAGVGTSCWFLAEAGLLEGLPATTHWYYFDQFQKRYPNVLLKRNHFITQAGNIYCTGSVNSLADLTVQFIRRYFNDTIASHVERHFFHEIRRAYDSSHAFLESNSAHPDEDIVQTQLWLQLNYSIEVRLSELAEQFGMSTRTFNRRFKAATGTTPLHYLQDIRLNTATDLLKNTNLSVNESMYRVGYQDGAYFTKLFKQKFSVTPSQYRTTVRAKLFRPEG